MPEVAGGKWLTTAGWTDVPHIDEDMKKEILENTPPHLRDARSKGTPSLGSGAIYPVPISEFETDPIEIPAWWPRCFGMDVGWNMTAAVWGALDKDTDVLYLYTEHYRAHAEPSTHVAAIKGRGDWIPGVCDPAARGRSQKDGAQLMYDYTQLGLNIVSAENLVESGLYNVFTRLTTGRLKVFKTMKHWFEEYSIYRRDEDGKIIKEFDHLMDATRYLVGPQQLRKGRASGLSRAMTKPAAQYASGVGSAAAGDDTVGY